MMEIRFVDYRDKDALRHMLMYCFGLTQERVDWFMEKIFAPDYCLGVYEAGYLAASLHILPFEIFYCGNIAGMGGIACVATLPEYRRSHCAARMLVESLKIMKERNQIFSMLGPFSYAFYRKYGWELAFHRKRYTLKMKDLANFGTGSGRFRPLTYNDIEKVNDVYERFVKFYNGAIKRTRNYWVLKFEDQDRNNFHRYGLEDGCGNLRGYIFFHIRDRKFYVGELAYTSFEAKEELFRFIYLHSAQAHEVIWEAPADDNTLLLLDNPRRSTEIVTGMMIRVVDVKAVLEKCSFNPDYSGAFILKIDDPWAPWNNQLFEVAIQGGGALVETIPESRNIAADLVCSIQTFSQIASGYIGLEDAVKLGRVKVINAEKFNEIKSFFPASVTYMNDYF